jgi:hypothetical protein
MPSQPKSTAPPPSLVREANDAVLRDIKQEINRRLFIYVKQWRCVVDVKIPYQKILATKVPVGKVEVRRLFGYVLGLLGLHRSEIEQAHQRHNQGTVWQWQR